MDSVPQLPICVSQAYHQFLTKNINQLPLATYHTLCSRLDSRGVVRELASQITQWQQGDVDHMMIQKSPGDEILHRLGNLNRTLGDVISYMLSIEFWPGLEFFLEKFAPILQTDIPRQMQTMPGQGLQLQCKAAGVPAPLYQWFSGRQKLDGQTTPTLSIPSTSIQSNGRYLCSIANECGNIYSSVCEVRLVVSEHPQQCVYATIRPVSPPRPALPPRPVSDPQPKFTAKDKVALLIGNGKHMSERLLKAPPDDIYHIGKKLQRMGFKTLMCKDLNKADMENIIDFFISLLDEGVYGIMYFAGHGFEEQKECFLVPSDAPVHSNSHACISARNIHRKMLARKTALCLLMLDICRVRLSHASDTFADNPVVEPNNATMVVYATCAGGKAWEVHERGANLSVFTNHLLKFIDEKIPVIRLMTERVMNSIANDQLANQQMQFPEIQCTLSTPRSLHDPIDYCGHTVIFKKTLSQWEKVNELPELREYPVPELGIKVRMVFQSKYSNSLIIYIACLKEDRKSAYQAMAHISNIHNLSVQGSAEIIHDPETWPRDCGFYSNNLCLSVTRNTIDGLERLEQDLAIDVLVDGSTQDGEKKMKTLPLINLKRPLLSKLNLADGKQKKKDEVPAPPSRVPVQHEDRVAVQDDESLVTQFSSMASQYAYMAQEGSLLPEAHYSQYSQE